MSSEIENNTTFSPSNLGEYKSFVDILDDDMEEGMNDMAGTNFSREEANWMEKALVLAEQARGRTSPNPLVGAVVVRDGKSVGEGYHRQAGEPHAEVAAIDKAGELARGATLFVTLEPCCHEGKTPPCTKRIISSGIKQVIVAMKDPNPLVAGKGIEELEGAGIVVACGLFEEEARKLNEVFVKYITSGRPFVTMKAAVSLDGKIATRTGESRWITGKASREYVHRQRSFHDAIMVGVETVLADNPLLTCRLPEREPRVVRRIILDSRGRTPADANVLKGPAEKKTIIAATGDIPAARMMELKGAGAEVLVTEAESNGRVNLAALMEQLGKRAICSVLIEGGGRVNAAAVKAGIVDKLLLFIAPKIIGGRDAPTFIEGEGIEHIEEAWPLCLSSIKRYDDDIMCEYYFTYNRMKSKE
jgi:diaminohydroxyphosphoribosylaminopyrimidine deaminase/5-amino-6-(5-phosphoribosylamino)uracil reductase